MIIDIFRGAMAKLSRRVAQFLPHKRSFSLQNRVLISNTFLTPILSYLFTFFVLGEQDAKEVERLISSWVISGRKFRYDHLTAQSHCAGLTIPLHDVLKLNIASLLCGKESFVAPRAAAPHYTIDGASMLISEHIHKATSLFFGLTAIIPPDDEAQSTLYTILQRKDETSSEALVDTLSPRLGPTNARLVATWVIARCGRLPRSLPSKLRTHAFLLIYNAVPTHDRLDPRHVTYALCELCGQARETLSHLHTECGVSRVAARRLIRYQVDQSKYLVLQTAPPEDYIFRSPDSEKLHALVLLCFSLAVWRARCAGYGKPSTPATRERAPQLITKTFQALMKSCTHKMAKKVRDKRAEKALFMQQLSLLPPHACVAYTDGSSYGNPGPAGAGFTVVPSVLVPGASSSVCLGVATNNVAELAALQFLCEHLCELLSRAARASRPPVFVFIDNRFTIEGANSDKKCKANRKQVAMTRRAVSDLRALTDVSLRWVPAHAEVEGNEDADTLAKRGAKGTTSRDPPAPAPPSAPAAAQLHPHPILDPDLELADDLDPERAPLHAPIPDLPRPCTPAATPVVTVRRSSRLQSQVRTVPAALYRGGKVDFSSAWPTKHRRCSSARDALPTPPSLSAAALSKPLSAPHRKRKSPSPAYARSRAVRVEAPMLSYAYTSSSSSSSSSVSSPSAPPSPHRKRKSPDPVTQPHTKRRNPNNS